MFPWSHLVVGYLSYSILVHLTLRRSPRDAPTLALVLGTQFPDIVDKPLAWTFHILPNGRSLAHSLLTAVVVLTVLQLFSRWRGSTDLVTAFGVGYLTHLAGDAIAPLLTGEYHLLGFLAWPLVPPVEYDQGSFLSHLSSLDPAMFSATELVLFGFVLAVWFFDGMPGIPQLRSLLRAS